MHRARGLLASATWSLSQLRQARAGPAARCLPLLTGPSFPWPGRRDPPAADAALEQLCPGNRYPLHAHVRRRGHAPEEAQDLTQPFFERLLERSLLRAVDRHKGRFRTFLLTALDHFLAKEWWRDQAQKRGGGRLALSLDDDTGEDRYRREPAHDETPDRLFERRWALAVLEQAMRRLAAESASPERRPVFEALQPVLGGDRAELPHAQLAARLGLSENALHLTLLRLRRRYGELIREVIAETVAAPEELEAELRHRMQATVPEVFDISQEPPAILELYGAKPGANSFANNCLQARRLVERGVCCVQLFDWGWDIHGTSAGDDLMNAFPKKCREVDRASAALVRDLKQRGLLDETLVVWGSEIGRTPMNEARNGSTFLGRDHHPGCFTIWLAGGGVKPGLICGETDDFGYTITRGKTSVRDLQATILHLLGFDPYQLSFPYLGLRQRLIGPTDEGRVVKEWLV